MPSALPFTATRFCVKQWMPTFSNNKEQQLGLGQPSLDLTWLEICLITTTLPGAPGSWLGLALIFPVLDCPERQ